MGRIATFFLTISVLVLLLLIPGKILLAHLEEHA